VFIRSLTPSAKDKWLARGAEAIVYTWAVVAIFGTAFECSVPRTWDLWNGQCFNLVGGVYFVPVTPSVPNTKILMRFNVIYPVSLALFHRYFQHCYRPHNFRSGDDPDF
jgi:hypothetical protein